MGSATITSTQNWTAPTGVTSVQVECWGCGGNGAANKLYSTNYFAGGGGGGGAYSKKTTISVTPGNSYLCTVPSGGSTTKTSFINESTVCADYGIIGNLATGFGSPGTGGSAGQDANSVGDTVTSGTDGGGSTSSGGSGGTGASPGGGGGGGGGGFSPADGHAGAAPGGGGGGASGGGTISRQGGAGAAGQIVITWVDVTTITPGVRTVSITKYAPALSIVSLARIPGKASLVVTGYAPAKSINPGLSPPPATLRVTGASPKLVSNLVPARAILVITGRAPTVARHLVPPGTAHIVITGRAPSVVIPPPLAKWSKVR